MRILRKLRSTLTEFDLELLTRQCESAVKAGVFPGASFSVGTADRAQFGIVGHLDYQHGQSVSKSTIYDLASITKPICTTTSAMCFFQDGAFELGSEVRNWIPEFHPGVTIGHLLSHTSGLPAHRDFWKLEGTAEDRLRAVLSEPLVRAPGSGTEYSCVGFIVLATVLQRISGEVYPESWTWPFFRICEATGMEFHFNPPASLSLQIAPTEEGTPIGVVHDENARSLGGISGNAGLFGTAEDVARFAQLILRGGEGFILPEVIQGWTKQQSADSTRALGWDTHSGSSDSSAGVLFNPESFGHTGFTGTSLWIDPKRGIFAGLLTNRVHPTRENTAIIEFRRKFHDSVVESIT